VLIHINDDNDGVTAYHGIHRRPHSGCGAGMRVFLILVSACCLAHVFQTPLSAQAPRDAGIRWASAPSLPAGTISGIVSDAFTGQPLRNTAVTAGTTSAVTDSLGRFAITSKPGTVELYVYRVGYGRLEGRLQLSSGNGVLVHVGLHMSESGPCTPVVTYADRSVAVRVRDVATGRAPDALVALNVARAGKPASVRGEAKGADFVLLEVATDTGRYDLSVQANGYAPWHLADVGKEEGQCQMPIVRPFNVWLLPVRHTPSDR
jgi:hypothetical protein